MAKRRAISTRTRFEVFKRDRFTCQYCGRTPPKVILEVDHIQPVSKGGGGDEGNLVTACFDCNRGKADGLLTEAPRPLNDQIAERREKSAQMAAYNEFLMEERSVANQQIMELGIHWCNFCGHPKDKFTFGKERTASVRRFLQHLPLAQIYDAIDLAHARRPVHKPMSDQDTWKYFCGICWKMIRDANGGATS